MTTTSCHHHHCCRSSLRTVPADEVDDFQFFWVYTRTPLQVQDNRFATISTPRLNTWRRETFWPSGMRQWNSQRNTVQGQRTQKTGHNKLTGHHISTSRSNTGHSRMWIHTHHTGYSTSCAAFSDSHNTACYSDCQSTATIKAFISVSTASIFSSCWWPAAWDFQTTDVYFEPSKDS